MAAERPDPLAALISLLRPQTVASKLISGAGRWSIQYQRQEHASFCLVLAGACFFAADGLGVIELQKGDFVFLPETPGFTLARDLRFEPTPTVPTSAHEVRHGSASGRVSMRMLGGYFRFDRANAPLVIKLLPPVVHIQRDAIGGARVRRIVELIVEEANTHRPGREPILDRLVEVLIIESLRFRVAGAQEHGLIAGLSDAALARALRAVHADVARRWTVAELARTAGMSRAVFAERFAQTVGMPPMQYVLEWRVAMAKHLLLRERLGIAEVAEKVGYESSTGFSTAFSRLTGCSPRDFALSERGKADRP